LTPLDGAPKLQRVKERTAYMEDKYPKDKRKVGKGSNYIAITTIYLWSTKAGLRIEVKRFTWTRTVEIDLLIGGGNSSTLKTIYNRRAISSPSKKQIDRVVDELIQYAKDKGLIKSEQGEEQC
jgi:hypothetical protein